MPYAQIGEKKCFYQDIGQGYPLLLGHSFLWDSYMWKPQLEALSEEFRCIAVDLWSHGKSDCLNENSYTLENCADDYYELMKQLKISQFGVIGLSVGGMWGAHLALKYPDAVSSLVLMDTYVGSEPKDTQQKYFHMINTIEKEQKFSEPLVDALLPLFFSPHTITHRKKLTADFKNSLLNRNPKHISGIVKLGRMIFTRENLLDKLKKITCPSLVIVGQDDIPRPVEESQEMADLLPNADLHIIKNAGHISNLEQPIEATSILASFLEKVCFHYQ